MITFKILRNTTPYKKLKAKSIEEAKGMLRKMPSFNKDDYFELKAPDGKVTPVFAQ